MRHPSRNGQSGGFTLIELLIVVAIIGVIAAIAIPNLLNAVDRAKQKKTMADIRSIGTAAQSYAVDVNFYPRGYNTLTPVGTSVEKHIAPIFIRDAPDEDGWGGQLLYQSNARGSSYTLLSYGKDHTRSTESRGKTLDFDCDIIFWEGQFVAWPEGIQK